MSIRVHGHRLLRKGPKLKVRCKLGTIHSRWRMTSELHERTKKADVVKHPKVFDHVGLLVNQPLHLCRVAVVSSRPPIAGRRRELTAPSRRSSL